MQMDVFRNLLPVVLIILKKESMPEKYLKTIKIA